MTFPALRGRGPICVDVETRDPSLKTRGPGWAYGQGYIAGVAVATEGRSHYFGLRHEGGGNHNPQDVLAWLREELSGPELKIGHNLSYDLGWLQAEGVEVRGPIFCTYIAEKIIDETQLSFSLEAVATKYLQEGKRGQEMERYLVEHFGRRNKDGSLSKNQNVKGDIWRAPADVVERYAKGDVELPLRFFKDQYRTMEKEETLYIFQMEMQLLRILNQMRRRGVAVNVTRAQQLYDEFEQKKADLMGRLPGVDGIMNANQIARLFDSVGIKYPRTDKTNAPSVTRDVLAKIDHQYAKDILEARELDKLAGTFLQSYVIEGHHQGRLHCSFNQLGAETGRMSSSNPNLQNIPARSEAGSVLRELFVPDEGCDFFSADFSQIEFRLLVSDAADAEIAGAGLMADRYNQEADLDFHQMVAEMTGLQRKYAKTITFAAAYGAGPAKIAESMGVDLETGKQILAQYHQKAPFLKGLSELFMRSAIDKGYVTTFLNRRRHYNLWETPDGTIQRKEVPYARRAYTYAALNARIQGSAADIFKDAAVAIHNAGLMDVLNISLFVHDEISGSVPRTKEGAEALKEMQRLMETTNALRVPLLVDCKTGANWGEAK